MYFHSRSTGNEFTDIVSENRHRFPTGVVHCFTGSQEELKAILALDLYVGVTGLSFKTEQNMQVVRQIPLDKLLIETDSPYCDIKTSFAGYKYIKTFFPRAPKDKYV